MGWCSAFGPQIRDGCDHAMVAASDSCHCRECGAACHGRFPGCAQVWAGATAPGPGGDAATRPAAAPGPGGNAATRLAAAPGPGGNAATRPAAVVPEGPPDLRELRVDLQLLMWKVDRLRQEVRTLGDAGRDARVPTREVADALAALPDQVERAVARALRTQRRETRELVALSERRVLDAMTEAFSADNGAAEDRGEASTQPGRRPQVTSRARPGRSR